MSKSLINQIQLLEIENEYLRNKIKKLEEVQSVNNVIGQKLFLAKDSTGKYKIYDHNGVSVTSFMTDDSVAAFAYFNKVKNENRSSITKVLAADRINGKTFSLTQYTCKHYDFPNVSDITMFFMNNDGETIFIKRPTEITEKEALEMYEENKNRILSNLDGINEVLIKTN